MFHLHYIAMSCLPLLIRRRLRFAIVFTFFAASFPALYHATSQTMHGCLEPPNTQVADLAFAYP